MRRLSVNILRILPCVSVVCRCSFSVCFGHDLLFPGGCSVVVSKGLDILIVSSHAIPGNGEVRL